MINRSSFGLDRNIPLNPDIRGQEDNSSDLRVYIECLYLYRCTCVFVRLAGRVGFVTGKPLSYLCKYANVIDLRKENC